MANSMSAEQTQQIEAALARGEKISAIKLYRDFTGEGLKESKDVIDALAAELVRRDPTKYAALARTGHGCATMLVLTLGAAAALIVVVRAWPALSASFSAGVR